MSGSSSPIRALGVPAAPVDTRESFPVRVLAFSSPASPFESRRVLQNPLDSVSARQVRFLSAVKGQNR